MTRHEALRTAALTLVAAGAVTAGALGLAACADASGARALDLPPDASPGADAPAPEGCYRAEDCADHNAICNFEGGRAPGRCGPPAAGGECSPSGDPPYGESPGCYPGARCQEVPRERSAMGGLCSFQAPQAPLFTSAVALPKISATRPNALSVLRPADGVSLEWTQPALPPDAVTVAVVLGRAPSRDGYANRLANGSDLVWIWSSTEPGANARPGAVPLDAGRRGLAADGALGPAFGTTRLAAGRYWWFVYALRNGSVVAASDVLSFRVGGEFMSHPCAGVDDCVRLLPGETPETVACVERSCRRRCASDFDCPGVGARCDFQTTLPGTGRAAPRRGAYCTPVAVTG